VSLVAVALRNGLALDRNDATNELGRRQSGERAMIFPLRRILCVFVAVVVVLAGVAARAAAEATPKLDPQYKVGAWIWAPVTSDKQTCRFWRAVEISSGSMIVEAHLRITADNAYRLFLDGKELGRGTEWRSLTDYDLTWALKPGLHVLAVEAFNEYLDGGIVAGLQVEFADSTRLEVPSDETWKLVPAEERGWTTRKSPRAHWTASRVMAPYLGGIWKSVPARIVRQAPVQPIVEKFWQAGWFQVALVSVCVVVVLLCAYLLSRLALQATAQEVLQRERARIARDIHDDFGARLTKLVLVGELAQTELAPSPLRARFEQVSTEGRNLLGALDEVVWTVNSRRDTVRDFETYVCNYAETFLHPTAIRLRIDSDAELPEAGFDLPIRRNLFLAVKEALNNAVRHSGATELTLGIHLHSDQLTVSVADNGRGFDPAAADRERNGLTNIAQRTAEVGGTCRIASQPGAGCRIELTAPLRHRRRSLWRWTNAR
jgi:signal transduction histidine kinase